MGVFFSLSEIGQDGFNDPICVSEHVVVPESNNPVALAFKPSCPTIVASYAECMLPAVHFNDELPLGADEVDDITADGCLAPK